MRSILCKVYLCIFIFPNTIVDSKAHFRIIGGEKTEEDEYPWFYRSNGCGGSLIAADIVLTAAHCSSSYEVDDTFAAQYIHPRYFESDSHVGNDFMVVKLNEPLEDVTPVPLDTGEASFKYEQNQSLWALGYGDILSDDKLYEYPEHLHHVEVKYIDQCTCGASYNNLIDSSMMCSADVDKDACQGDSGGPLYDKDNDVLVGVVSWGYGCASANYPGVYARIADQLLWIQRTVCEESDFPPSFCDDESICENTDWQLETNSNVRCDWFEKNKERCEWFGDSYFSNGLVPANEGCCICGGGTGPYSGKFVCPNKVEPGTTSGSKNVAIGKQTVFFSILSTVALSFVS